MSPQGFREAMRIAPIWGSFGITLLLAGCMAEEPSTTPPPTTTAATTTTVPTTTTPAPTTTTTTTAPTTTTTTPAAPPRHVHVGGGKFDPASLTIQRGETVEWDLHDGSHTVTIRKDSDLPTSPYRFDRVLQDRATYTFDEAGHFRVFCRFHSSGDGGPASAGMVSTVDVS